MDVSVYSNTLLISNALLHQCYSGTDKLKICLPGLSGHTEPDLGSVQSWIPEQTAELASLSNERQGLQCRQLWQVETMRCWHWATLCKQRHLWLDRQQCLRRVQPWCVAPQLGGQWLQHGGCQGLMDVGAVVDGADHCSLSCGVMTHSH